MRQLIILAVVFALSDGGRMPPLTCPNGDSIGPYCRTTPCKGGYFCYGDYCCPSTKCKSGVWGPSCRPQDYTICKPGYTCIDGGCCRDPCPKGWKEGPSCNSVQGQHRCPGNFQCKDGVCCRPPIVLGVCPRVIPFPKKHCLFWKPGAPMCSSDADCAPGLRCCPDICNWRSCKKPVMNKGK